MRKYAGLFIGSAWVIIAFGAFRRGLDGWAGGHMDLAVWWAVIGGLLLVAAGGALVGTWIHAWQDDA